MRSIFKFIESNELAIRTLFRTTVVLLLVVCLVQINKAIDMSNDAYGMAYEANMNAESAASEAKDASYKADICRELRFR